jgi:hypothetical protein
VAQDGPRDGVAFCAADAMAAPSRLAFATRPASWQLSFDGVGATYRALSESEAYAMFTTRRATARSADALDWLTDLGDFIEGVAGGVLDVVEYIVTPVGNLVMAGVRLFIESVEYFFEQVIRVVEDAFDIVESVLAKVKVFFERTFEWIGFLFDWTDIVLTHEALSYTIDQTLGFLEGAVSGMQTLVDNGITNVQARLASLFQDAIRNIAQSYSLGGYDDANQQMSPMFSGASANNLLYNALIDNGGSARMTSAPRPLPENNPFGPAMRKLTELADFTRSEAAFSSAVQYFTNLGGSPDQIFAQLLSALMEIAEGLLQAVLSGAKAAVDAVFAVARDIISALRGMLQNEWDIPLVSPLFAYFTNGAKLNTLNLMSIIVAAPTTILYKAVNGQTPFRNEQDVAAFRALFDAQSMIRASGLGGTTSALRIATGGLLPKPLALLVALGHALAQGFFGAMSAVIDFIPKDAPRVLIEITFLLEVASQAFGFPWFNTSGAPDCSTADGAAKFNWIVEDYGLLLDGLFVAFEGRIPENAHDVGVIVAFVYALGHLAMAVVASIPASGIAIAANLTPVIAELGKILRLDGIVSATNRISLPVCAALDAIFFTTGAVLEFIEYATGKPDVAALPVVA